MDLMDGDLAAYSRSPNADKTEEHLKGIFRQISSGLEHLHKYHIIHHDLKPENVLVRKPEGQPLEIKIADFGLSTGAQTLITMTVKCGTLAYMAPETFHTQPCLVTDMWAMGIMLYEIATGLDPYYPMPFIDEDLALVEVDTQTTSTPDDPFQDETEIVEWKASRSLIDFDPLCEAEVSDQRE
ncbi:kinase-like protein [Dacryopinax primogenitus]|uniref:non-specific serine/threonine protein kinase n=1 Tax=Dacryopinax primogenitus (strain DJM 731) TaxID=1858805 RepID=M5GE22_DACPD|nr:kinase-like protein [Dacryopinax primogenitus]EJU02908.1 kinase-like protein [Dacryopinax primogenitus]